MKIIALTAVLMLVVCGSVMGASPTPAPSPSPSPSPVPPVIDNWAGGEQIPVNLYYYFTAACTDEKLIDIKTGEEFTVPSAYKFYVTDISWTCASSVNGTLEWAGTYSDVVFDRVFFPYDGQGKCPIYGTPLRQYNSGVSPVLTTDRVSIGTVYVNGYLR